MFQTANLRIFFGICVIRNKKKHRRKMHGEQHQVLNILPCPSTSKTQNITSQNKMHTAGIAICTLNSEF